MMALFQTLAGLNPVLEILSKITILFIVGWSIHVMVRRGNPRWRILLWRAVGCGIVVIPALVLLAPKLTVPVQIARQDVLAENLVNSSLQLPTQTPIEISAEPSFTDMTSAVKFQAENASEVSSAGSVPDEINVFRKYPWLVLGIVWAGVALGLFALTIKRSFAFRRIMSDTLPAPASAQQLLYKIATDLGCKCPALRVSAVIPAPILFGVRQPVILLPNNLLTECHELDLTGILAHELSHLRSNDLSWTRFIQALSILLWFHPLVWGLRRAHDLACELVCDRVASDVIGNSGQYSRMLADMALAATSRQQLLMGLSMARQPDILFRLESLKRKIQGLPLRRSRKAMALVSGIILMAFVTCVKIQLVHAQIQTPAPQTFNITPTSSTPAPPSPHASPAPNAMERNEAITGSVPSGQQSGRKIEAPIPETPQNNMHYAQALPAVQTAAEKGQVPAVEDQPVIPTAGTVPPAKADPPPRAITPAAMAAPAIKGAGSQRWIEFEILPVVINETHAKWYSSHFNKSLGQGANAKAQGPTSATLDYSSLDRLGSQVLSELDLHRQQVVRESIIRRDGPDNLNLHVLEAVGVLRLLRPASLKLRNGAGAQVTFLSQGTTEADVLRQLKEQEGDLAARVSPFEEMKTDVAIRQPLEFQLPHGDVTGFTRYNWLNTSGVGAPQGTVSTILVQFVPHLDEASTKPVSLDLRVLMTGPISDAAGMVGAQTSGAKRNIGVDVKRAWLKKLIASEAKVTDGGTIILGGFSGTFSQELTATAPFFGKLPIVGKKYFTRHHQQNDRVTLLLFVRCKLD